MPVLGTLPWVHLRLCCSTGKRWSSLCFGGKPIACPCLFQLEKRMSLPLSQLDPQTSHQLFESTLQPSRYLSKQPVHLNFLVPALSILPSTHTHLGNTHEGKNSLASAFPSDWMPCVISKGGEHRNTQTKSPDGENASWQYASTTCTL